MTKIYGILLCIILSGCVHKAAFEYSLRKKIVVNYNSNNRFNFLLAQYQDAYVSGLWTIETKDSIAESANVYMIRRYNYKDTIYYNSEHSIGKYNKKYIIYTYKTYTSKKYKTKGELLFENKINLADYKYVFYAKDLYDW